MIMQEAPPGPPSAAVEVIGGDALPHANMWTDEFLSAAFWFQDQSKGVAEPLLCIWSAQLNTERFISFSPTRV